MAPGPHKTSGYDLPNIVSITEEQGAVIRVALYNNNTMRNEFELQDAIGKHMPNLVKPGMNT